MTIKKIFFFSFILFSTVVSVAQEQQTCITDSRNPWQWPGAKHWFVGNFPGTLRNDKAYILDFNNSPFTVTRRGDGTGVTGPDGAGGWINDGQYSYEGIIAASNDNGEFVYYSNGIKAWNSAGTEVSNSVGEGSEGQRVTGSAAQGIISVRHPLTPYKYYAIATSDVIGGALNTSYNLFDETGAEIKGNTDLPGGIVAAEGISATLHANGVDVWVVVQQDATSNLQAWLLTCDGFITDPVASDVAVSVTGNPARGGIAFSHDGKKLASVFPAGDKFKTKTCVFDFDNKTGKFSNRKDVSNPLWNISALGYDVVWSKDNSELIVGNAIGNRVFRVDLDVVVTYDVFGVPVNTNIFFVDGPDETFHAVEIGPDGNYYFNGKDGMWKWDGTSTTMSQVGSDVGSSTDLVLLGSSDGQGLPSIYIPPAEEPEIQDLGPFCDTVPEVQIDIHTNWVCSGVSAEDSLYEGHTVRRHNYYLLDSNYVKENGNQGNSSYPHDARSGAIVGQKTGFFNPAVAGPGKHSIVFEYCDVNDTIVIEVTKCGGCNNVLKDITKPICVGETYLLDSLIEVASADGKWSIDSVPDIDPDTDNTDDAVIIDQNVADTLFDASSLSTKPGIYKVVYTVTDGAQECKDSVHIKVNKLPIVTVPNDTICIGDDAVTLTATVDSITDVAYKWGGLGTGDLKTTSAKDSGSYIMSVIDRNGCKDTTIARLIVDTLPIVLVNDSSICLGDAVAMFTASSVNSTIEKYVWGEKGLGKTETKTITSDIAGKYSVTVTDDKGCIGLDTGLLTIDTIPIVSVNDSAICFGGPKAKFTVTTKLPVKKYVWINDVSNNEHGFGNAPTNTGDVPGNYSVIVTDNNGCADTATGVLTVNALPKVTVNDSTICAGGSVSALFTAVSDSAWVSYSWSGSGNGTGVDSMTTGSEAGDYIATVIDTNGCTSSGTGTLKLSALPVVSVDNEERCNVIGDTAIFEVVSDVKVKSYAWSETVTGTDSIAKGLLAGDYIVIIKDINGCIGTDTGTLVVNELPVVKLDGGNVCPASEMTMSPTVTKGTLPLVSHFWFTRDTVNNTPWVPIAGENSSTLKKGQGAYGVVITDDKGCIGIDSTVIKEDPRLQVLIPGPVKLCEGQDSLLISNYKAVDGYDFVWSTVNGIDTTEAGNTTESITVDTSGVYHLAVSNGNCKGDTGVQVIVYKLPVVTVANDTICKGDPAVTFTAVSATAASYAWTKNGKGTDNTTSGTTAGEYIVVVEDDKGCIDSDTGALKVNDLPVVTVEDKTICAKDDPAEFEAVSATATTWKWNGKSTETKKTTKGTVKGDYTVIVGDVNGCADTATGVLTVNALPVAVVLDQKRCEGDPLATTFTATADSTISAYDWIKGGTGTSNTTTGTDAGDYTVAVIDIHQCKDTTTGVLTVNPVPAVVNDTTTICEGLSATAGDAVSGGPYDYAWNTTPVTTTATLLVTDGNNGVPYNRIVTNIATKCTSTSTHKVNENINPKIILSDASECEGDPITLMDALDTTGYTYTWNPGAVKGGLMKPTTSKTYTVTKRNNATDCISEEVTVSAYFVPIPNAAIAEDTIPICEGTAADLYMEHDAASVLWSNGATTNHVDVFTEGEYIAVASNGGCPAEDSVYVRVVQFPVSILDHNLELEPICFDDSDSVLILTANLDERLNYLWSNGEETNAIEAIEEGTYSVVLSRNLDNNGNVCEITDQITLRDFCPFTFYIPNAFSPDGTGPNEYFSAKGTYILEYELTVYDRWGLKIFQSDDINIGWDGRYKGRPVQVDVYVWKANFTVATYEGATSDYSKVGHVTVVR